VSRKGAFFAHCKIHWRLARFILQEKGRRPRPVCFPLNLELAPASGAEISSKNTHLPAWMQAVSRRAPVPRTNPPIFLLDSGEKIV